MDIPVKEQLICPYCKKDVTVYWIDQKGLVSRPKYTLVADWVYHTECWDKLVDSTENYSCRKKEH